MREAYNNNEMNKSMIINKIKLEDKNLHSLINEGFETADNYLKIKPDIIIGKLMSNNLMNSKSITINFKN